MTAQNSIPPSDLGPCNLEAEQAVLGACLMRNEAVAHVTGILHVEHFADPVHGAVYQAITDAVAAGKVANVVTLKDAFAHVQMPEGQNMRSYLAHLCAEAPPIINAPDYATVVRDLAHRRAIIAASNDLCASARNMPITKSPAKALDWFSEATRPILDSDDRSTVAWAGDIAEGIVDEIDRVQAGELRFETFTTGFAPLDKVTRYRPGEVVVTAGRPGAGKSIFATASSRRIAQTGLGILEFPLENGKDQAVSRHLADLAYSSSNAVFFSRILDRDLPSETDRARVSMAWQKLRDLPLVIDDSERITLARLGTRIKQVKSRLAARDIRLAVVMIDHLDYLDATDRYSGNRVQEIFEIMTGLKALARREKVQIHLFCQLNRQVEGRAANDRRPQLQDLRNSGDIEQCADVVNFLYREAYYAVRSPEYIANDPVAIEHLETIKNDLDVICAKVRTGPTKMVKLFCDPAASFISGRDR